MNILLQNNIKFSSLGHLLKDVLFPIFCIECNKEGSILCEECRQKIILEKIFFCEEKSFLNGHSALFWYKDESVVAHLIHELKYNYIEEVMSIFTKHIFEFYKQNKDFFQNISCITPVPLHPRRLAERGFNQSDFIATVFSDACSIPLENLIKRKRWTRPQVGLSSPEREKNVDGAFIPTQDCVGKNIVLVDDVFTTGSTIQACAKVLKENGAKSVFAFALARAFHEKSKNKKITFGDLLVK